MPFSFNLSDVRGKEEKEKGMYRQDVLERTVFEMKKNNIDLATLDESEVNLAALARACGCDYRTVKAAIRKAKGPDAGMASKREPAPSKLDPFKDTVLEKMGVPCTAMAIYKFIAKRGYKGGYTTVRRYVAEVRGLRQRTATMRFETLPGRQAQVDWKEDMTLRGRDGRPITFNVFLMVLGFSRAKYCELTLDRSQETLFRCMCNAFRYFGGCPAEVLFDNMRTVAAAPRGHFGPGLINEVFSAFAKDCGFEPLLCESFHPYTKGKVEVAAKLMERLRPYDGELSSPGELSSAVSSLRDELNAEPCQATGKPPAELLAKEKDHLHQREWEEVLMYFCDRPRARKVSRDSCVSFEGVKYSVPPKYVGREVTVKVADGNLYVFYNSEMVRCHELVPIARIVFDREDYEAAMRSRAFRDSPDDVIEGIAKSNLAAYDEIGRI